MLDLTDVLAPAAAALAGFAAGIIRARRKRSKPAPAICPCEHSVAFHVAGTGVCQETVRRESAWSQLGAAVGYTYVACGCQVYAGPEVISSLTMRPTTYGEIAESEQP